MKWRSIFACRSGKCVTVPNLFLPRRVRQLTWTRARESPKWWRFRESQTSSRVVNSQWWEKPRENPKVKTWSFTFEKQLISSSNIAWNTRFFCNPFDTDQLSWMHPRNCIEISGMSDWEMKNHCLRHWPILIYGNILWMNNYLNNHLNARNWQNCHIIIFYRRKTN